jgi:cell division protein FtsB
VPSANDSEVGHCPIAENLFPFFPWRELLSAMNLGESIWDKLTRLVLALVVVAALLGIVLWYRPVLQENQRMREEKLELETKIAQETEISKKLEASLRALQDPKTVERLARERLSYAKPGEDVVHFDPPTGTNISTNGPGKP